MTSRIDIDDPYLKLLIDMALSGKSLRDKEIFRDVYLESKSSAQIAKERNISTQTVSRTAAKCFDIVVKDVNIKNYI